MGRILLVAILIALGFAGYQYTRSPQYQIASALRSAASAAEDNNPRGAMTYVSGNYRGLGGNIAGLETGLQQSLGDGGWSSVSVIDVSVRMNGDKDADVTACVSFNANDASDKEAAFQGLYELQLGFTKDSDGAWRADFASADQIQPDPAIKHCR